MLVNREICRAIRCARKYFRTCFKSIFRGLRLFGSRRFASEIDSFSRGRGALQRLEIIFDNRQTVCGRSDTL